MHGAVVVAHLHGPVGRAGDVPRLGGRQEPVAARGGEVLPDRRERDAGFDGGVGAAVQCREELAA